MHQNENILFAYGFWPTVAFSILIVLFVAFSFVKPVNKYEWRSMGAFIGFVVALFTEMYGVPLTIYFLTSIFGDEYPVINPFTHANGHLVLVALGLSGNTLAMIFIHIVTNAIIFFGFYLVYQGWKLIHQASNESLVTEGVYHYIRHPQYTGFWLVTLGFLIQWPTIITLIMWPVLMILYYRLARREDKMLKQKFGKAFDEYKKTVPALLPRIKKEAM